MKDELEKDYKLKVLAREISIHEVINSSKEGRLLEIFGAATHCSLQPINRVVYRDSTIVLNPATFSASLNKKLNGIMKGSAQNNKWVTPFE